MSQRTRDEMENGEQNFSQKNEHMKIYASKTFRLLLFLSFFHIFYFLVFCDVRIFSFLFFGHSCLHECSLFEVFHFFPQDFSLRRDTKIDLRFCV